MKTLLLLLLSTISLAQPCAIFGGNEEKQGILHKIHQKHHKYKEYFNISGWSAISQYELINGISIKYESSKNKERITKHLYKDCIITMILDSNNDTGNDLITFYFGNTPIYTREFGDNDIKIKLSIHLNNASQLRIAVTNSHYSTPGAFSAIIKIKEI